MKPTTHTIRPAVILRIVGWLLLLESAMMAAPLAMAIACSADIAAFLIPAIATALCGGGLSHFLRHSPTSLTPREGYLLTALVWVIYTIFGMLPFMLSSTPLPLTEACFETMSGFTTTGATVITDVESCSRPLLLWRALIQWIGGLGIILFIIALLPALDQSGGLSVFNAEITGITHDKLHPRIRRTALSLWGVYTALTIAMILLLWAGPMDLFESVCQSCATLATGGFSTRNAGIAAFGSPYAAWIITLFMFLGGTNFALIYNCISGRMKRLVTNPVFIVYTSITLLSALLFSLSALLSGASATTGTLLLNPLFQAVSAITSTGFTYLGFESWGPAGIAGVMLLMVCGACAGSTTGGIKVDRIMACRSHIANEINATLFPRHVRVVRIGDTVLDTRLTARVTGFIALYLVLLTATALVLCALGTPVTDSFFASASCIGNNGLGCGVTAAGYASLHPLALWALTLIMLIGRLELFTVVILFTRRFWCK